MLGCHPYFSDNYGCPDLATLQEGRSPPFFALEGDQVSGQEISFILEVPMWVFRWVVINMDFYFIMVSPFHTRLRTFF